MTRCIIAVLLLALSGCGLKPIPYPTPTSEMPDQPGLLTGESGEAVIYHR